MVICKDCIHYVNGKCKKFNTVIANANLLTDCQEFSKNGKQQINKPKGIQIRDSKRKRNNKKMRQVKNEQIGLCRFVWVEYMIFKSISGKMRPYKEVGNLGLQIENKVYLNDGTYKFVNNKHLKIKKIYDYIPSDASEKLIELYKKNQ